MPDPLLFPGVLSPSVAASIRREMDEAPGQDAWITSGTTGEATVDPKVRSTRTVDVSPATAQLVRDHMWAQHVAIAQAFGGISSIETPSFLLYRVGDHFTVHTDRNNRDHTGRIAAVSLFIATDAPGEDALRIYTGDPRGGTPVEYFPIEPVPGLMVAFSSDAYHEVMSVAANRYTAVSWLLA